jgi:hypothetical protein
VSVAARVSLVTLLLGLGCASRLPDFRDDPVRDLSRAASAALAAGQPQRALKLQRGALAAFEAGRGAGSEGELRIVLATALERVGERDAAAAEYAAARQAAERDAQPRVAFDAAISQARLALDSADHAAAQDGLDAAGAIALELGIGDLRAAWLTERARLELADGRPRDAAVTAGEACRLFSLPGRTPATALGLARASVVRGDALVRLEQRMAAVGEYRAAAAGAAFAGDHGLEALARVRIGFALLDAGFEEDGRVHLEAALDLFLRRGEVAATAPIHERLDRLAQAAGREDRRAAYRAKMAAAEGSHEP